MIQEYGRFRNVLVILDLYTRNKDLRDNPLNKLNPYSIMFPRVKDQYDASLSHIKTETHDVDPIEFIGFEHREKIEQLKDDSLYKPQLRYIRILYSFEELISYIKQNIETEIITLNFGIATHPETDFNGHELEDWVRRIKARCPEEFYKLKWRFANTWDVYGHQQRHWLPWFSNSIKLIDKSKLTIEIANVDVAKTLRTKMPDANVIYNAVYFKRIVKSNIAYSPDSNFKMSKLFRTKHFMCLNNYPKPHRAEIVDHIFKNCDENRFYVSYLSENILLDNKQTTGRHEIVDWQDTPPYDVARDTYCYIATETFYHSNYNWHAGKKQDQMMTPFITEKTFKGAYYYLPMLIVGMQGSLRVFKELGFESFPEFFDESYDDELNPVTRMEKIKTEIKKLQDMPLSNLHDLYHSKPVQEKLIHNKQQFNKYIRLDPLCNMVKLDKLYKPNTPFIGLNPHLDEIYLDK